MVWGGHNLSPLSHAITAREKSLPLVWFILINNTNLPPKSNISKIFSNLSCSYVALHAGWGVSIYLLQVVLSFQIKSWPESKRKDPLRAKLKDGKCIAESGSWIHLLPQHATKNLLRNNKKMFTTHDNRCDYARQVVETYLLVTPHI